MNRKLIDKVISFHNSRFGSPPRTAAFAPGRIEVLGNHTDYNGGYVLSAAIDSGVCVTVSKTDGNQCVLVALDAEEETEFDLTTVRKVQKPFWANYVIGVAVKLGGLFPLGNGFNLTFAGDVPQGAGLSSSAAFEVATALVLGELFGLTLDKMRVAKLCQQAENEFAGARCGLLDQISSLFGKEHALIFTDFRSLAVETVPTAANVCFLLANTRVKHNLVESAYNERRAACEQAAKYFAGRLNHPAHALRDVTLEELEEYSTGLDPVISRRARHICGENERVLEARRMLFAGRLGEFGKLMFESHESSRVNFENSCIELDFIVDTAARLPQVFGARLSGGGFGGSVVMLIKPEDAAEVGRKISDAYAGRFGAVCDVRVVTPSAGARTVDLQ